MADRRQNEIPVGKRAYAGTKHSAGQSAAPVKIGMITHYYDPEGGAAATPGVIARALAKRGNNVEVLTGFPNYPSGQIQNGYKQSLYEREVIDGITVHRVPIYPSHNDRALPRILNFLSFGVSSLLRAPWVFRSVDVQFVYFSPATSTLGAIPLAIFRGVPIVLLIQDMWPDSVTESGFLPSRINHAVEWILHRCCHQLYRRSSLIAVTSPGMAKILVERGVPSDKLSFVPNWSNEAAFRPESRDEELREELGLSRRFSVMYAGNFGELQNLETVITCARSLSARKDIGFVLVGAGVREQALRSMVSDWKLDNVRFVSPRPFSEMSRTLALADCQLVTLNDSMIMRSTLPSKLQANMAAGSPVIGALAGDAARVIEASNGGIVVPPGDARALAEAVERLADMGDDELATFASNSRDYYLDNFSEDVVSSRLEHLLKTAAEHARLKRIRR